MKIARNSEARGTETQPVANFQKISRTIGGLDPIHIGIGVIAERKKRQPADRNAVMRTHRLRDCCIRESGWFAQKEPRPSQPLSIPIVPVWGSEIPPTIFSSPDLTIADSSPEVARFLIPN